MTTQITWTITQLDRLTSDGFVTTAHWNASATDGEFSASVYSTCSFGASEDKPALPYEGLTEEEILSWIWDNGVDKDATEAALSVQIEAQKNPVTATGLPWGQTE